MDKQIYETRHPEYQDIVRKSKFLTQSYHTGLNYCNPGNLFRYYNEDPDKYETRLNRSFPVNFMAPIVNEIVNSIMSKTIRRDSVEKEKTGKIKRFIANASGRKSLDKVMRQIAIKGCFQNVGVLIEGVSAEEMQAYGIDPNNPKIPKEKKEKLGLYARVKLFTPDKILNWSDGVDGLNWVLLDYSYIDNSDYNNISKVKKFVLWTKSECVIYFFKNESQTPTVTKFKHNIGHVPFCIFSHSDENDDDAPKTIYEDIALQQRTIYGWYSLMDENFYSTIFPILTINEVDQKLPDIDYIQEIKQGEDDKKSFSLTGNLLKYSGQTAPSLLKTDFVNVPFLLDAIDRVTKEIFRKVGKYLDANNVYAQSGAAKEIDNEQRNNNLQMYASQLEELENFILMTFCKFEGVQWNEYDMSVYPKDFDVRAIKDRIEEALNLKGLFNGVKIAEEIILKDIFEAKYGNLLTCEEKEELQKQIAEKKQIDVNSFIVNEDDE